MTEIPNIYTGIFVTDFVFNIIGVIINKELKGGKLYDGGKQVYKF